MGCTGNFAEMLEKCDIVLLLDNYREFRTEKYYEGIRAAINEGKRIVAMLLIGQKLDLKLYQGKCFILQNIPEIDFDNIKKEDRSGKVKHIIETPIIAVFGMGKSCCKLNNGILKMYLMIKC